MASSHYLSGTRLFVSPEGLSTALVKERQERKGSILIMTNDIVASEIDKHYNDLNGFYQFANCGVQGRIQEYMDKNLQSETAKACGLNIPITQTVDDKFDYRSVAYPCVVKPKMSIRGGKNIEICENEEVLRSAIVTYDNASDVLVQQKINKEKEIVLVGCSINGEVIIPAIVDKHRENKGGTTYATVRPITDQESDLVVKCKNLVNVIHYEGLFGIEFMKQEDLYYFTEMNLRTDATTYGVTVSGANLPLAYACNEACVGMVSPINMIVEWKDLKNVLSGRVSLLKWFREMKNAACKYYYSNKDIKPFFMFLIKRLH